MKDNAEILINSPEAHVDVLLQEFKQAGVMPNGWYDIAFNQEKRRMIWAGQSPDGRKWDENMPEGQPALPWDGCSDTRVPMVDAVCNDDTAVLCSAFDRGELRASTVNPDQSDVAAGVTAYLHWLARTKMRRPLNLETELSVQYSREHGFCVAYVGWERELGKRHFEFTMDELERVVRLMGAPAVPADPEAEDVAGDGDEPGAEVGDLDQVEAAMLTIRDPNQEEAGVALLQEVYRMFVTEMLKDKGFFPDELEKEDVVQLKASTAKRCLKELRETGETTVPMAYVVKNHPLVWVMQPYLEVLTARGTMMLQQSRAIFWRRWLTEAEVESKKVEGWDPDWCEEVKKTKGNIASWAGALGATSLTGPSTKTVGNTTFLKISEENNPLIEVVYAFVKKVDEDGVTGVWQTVFSPHITKKPGAKAQVIEEGSGQEVAGDFYATHELLDYAHGRYPFVELKRENIGRALIDTRSVAEIAGTWQDEEKNQRDMLFNRAQWDTLPPVRVPSLGGADYRLGPGAQVPMKRSDTMEAINLGAPPPQLALELVQMLRLQKDDYFGQFNDQVNQAKTGAKQSKAQRDFFSFWGEVLLHMFALTLQYNPGEIVKVTGMETLGQLDPFEVMEQLQIGLEFDIQELNPDYLMRKLEAIHDRVLPADAGGVIDRAALTNLELRMLDPRLAAKVVMDRGQASQQVYRDTELQVMKMALGNEAEYTENDPTAPMKLSALQSIVQTNPKYQQWLQSDQRFQELMKNYTGNLQMSIEQQQNKMVGRIGVKPIGAGPAGGPGQMAPGVIPMPGAAPAQAAIG